MASGLPVARRVAGPDHLVEFPRVTNGHGSYLKERTAAAWRRFRLLHTLTLPAGAVRGEKFIARDLNLLSQLGTEAHLWDLEAC